MMHQKVIRLFLLFILLAAMSGCVQETSDGATTVFKYELWVPLSVLLAGIVAAPAGWYLRDNSRYGFVLLIGGPILALLFAPSLFRDRAEIDESGFTVRTGIWGLTAAHDVKFEELQRIRLISEEKSGRRGRKTTNYYMLCERKDGTSAKVPLGNKVAEAAAPSVLIHAAELGIPVNNET